MDAHGVCDGRFAAVGEEFQRNLDERGEVGASVAVTVGGQTVVDLWGGSLDAEGTRPWEKESLCVGMSSTKGAVALAAHLLAAAGELDLDARVASYWPEFAAAGKEHLLVRHLLTHQAGLPALRAPLPAGAFYDWDAMVERLAAEEPFWEPGTRHGYHALTFGFLVGEVIARVTGRPFAEFFATEIAGPLGIDLFMGLPESEHGRVATLLPPPMPEPGETIPRFLIEAMSDPTSLAALVMGNNGGYLVPGEWDSPAALAAVIPSAGGAMHARALATMYSAIVHDRRVGRFTFDDEDIAQMGAVQSAGGMDAVLSAPGRWSLGFMKAGWTPRGADPEVVVSLSETAFGHTGNGGSIGFADPDCDLGFGYVMNQMSAAMGLGPTGQSLVDAVYRSLGYRRAKHHLWVR